MRRGLATGFVLPRITALSAARATRAQADLPEAENELLKPLDQLPTTMPAPVRAAFKARGAQIVHAKVKPAERDLAAEFFEQDYLRPRRAPASAPRLCRTGWPITPISPPGCGRETTTDMTPDQVFDLGQSEIARILRKASGRGDRRDRLQGRVPGLSALSCAPTRNSMSPRARPCWKRPAAWLKRVDDKLPGYFGKLPRLSYGVREVPARDRGGLYLRPLFRRYSRARDRRRADDQHLAPGPAAAL